MVVAIAERFARELRCCVGRSRAQQRILFCERELRVQTVDGARRAEDEPFHANQARGFQEVQRPQHVGTLVQMRRLNGRPHAGTRRQMDDHLRAVGLHDGQNARAITDVRLLQHEPGMLCVRRQVCPFVRRRIGVVEVVDHHDVISVGHQFVDEVATNEASPSRDQISFERHLVGVAGVRPVVSWQFRPTDAHAASPGVHDGAAGRLLRQPPYHRQYFKGSDPRQARSQRPPRENRRGGNLRVFEHRKRSEVVAAAGIGGGGLRLS